MTITERNEYFLGNQLHKALQLIANKIIFIVFVA